MRVSCLLQKNYYDKKLCLFCQEESELERELTGERCLPGSSHTPCEAVVP